MATPRTTRAALKDLRTAAHDLLDPVQRKILRDGGHTSTHTAPSLLDQLRDASGHSGETGHSAGGGTRIPIDAGALDLLAEITTGAVDAHDRALEHSQPSIEDHLRAAIALAEQWHEPGDIDWLTGWLQHWRRAIADQFDPRPRWHLAEACPACHATVAYREHSGEEVRVPALLVDNTTGADCQACGAHWAPEQLEQLAADIRAARHAGAA
jgi:hypothetical protein